MPKKEPPCTFEPGKLKGASMYKMAIKYKDRNGEEREENFYFNHAAESAHQTP